MTDFDNPWKEALDYYLEWFLQLCFPDVHRRIDWSVKPKTLDKELQQIAPQSETGKRFVDKLFEVRLLSCEIEWILIHLEVQNQRDSDFPKRMYVYFYRVSDKYNKIDWMMELPADMEIEFRSELYKFEEEMGMPYVTSVERLARQEGIEEGIAALLESRYGEAGIELARSLPSEVPVARLRSILKLSSAVTSLEEIRGLLTSQGESTSLLE